MSRPEDTYVKLPALVHATRLGYAYMSIKDMEVEADWDPDTNIFFKPFRDSLERINHTSISDEVLHKLVDQIKFMLQPEDLGRDFYNHLVKKKIGGYRLIDFDNIENNDFRVVTELPYAHDEDSFRPDIIFLINGMPLAFMEVKRPNNRDGILAERERMYSRFKQEFYRTFVNITQIMAFTNNEPYDDADRQPVQGSYYASSAYGAVSLSHFREERSGDLDKQLGEIDEDVAKGIYKDNNLASRFADAEYYTAINPNTPANSIITSLFSKERFLFFIKYGIAYVEKVDRDGARVLQKHIMRYPQLFAMLAIREALDGGTKKGVVWHTQGSGKTALAFFLSRYLKDYYSERNQVARFFFIVDRIDLATQAKMEFEARDAHVDTVQSRGTFIDAIQAVSDTSDKDVNITVVNLQKFTSETVVQAPEYGLNIQRVYFMDEAHRSYRPGGSFLSSFMASDPDAIKIALTGTPLIEQKLGYNTKEVFGDYFHRYFYNRSIADGYTLKLLREPVKSEFIVRMKTVVEQLKELNSEISMTKIYSHKSYVQPLVHYILEDYLNSQVEQDDDEFGIMIVSDSLPQARAIYDEILQYDQDVSAELVVHDEGTIEERRTIQRNFKDGTVDILVVCDMLLTGFDANRLKKMYLLKKIKAHNLLQALTRVNRPYKEFAFGYVVDFADISEEFDKTNQAYFEELQDELGDTLDDYTSIFEDPEIIEADLSKIKDLLFIYSTDNVVEFVDQISKIDDKGELYELRNALKRYRELHNVAKMYGYEHLYEEFDIKRSSELYREVDLCIGRINLKEMLVREDMMTGDLNVLLANIEWRFTALKPEEMTIADEFQSKMKKTYESFGQNVDPKDPEYVNLLDELRKKFKDRNIEEATSQDLADLTDDLDDLKARIDKLNEINRQLGLKYHGDSKFVRIHKRAMTTPPPLTDSQPKMLKLLTLVKDDIDTLVLKNGALLDNREYFTKESRRIVVSACKKNGFTYDAPQVIIPAVLLRRYHICLHPFPAMCAL